MFKNYSRDDAALYYFIHFLLIMPKWLLLKLRQYRKDVVIPWLSTFRYFMRIFPYIELCVFIN